MELHKVDLLNYGVVILARLSLARLAARLQAR